jgi:tetratricopeptide (TPR) repeat protein
MPPRIFISYRREDAAGDAGRLADHLHRRFGKNQVFLDIDTIDPGTDFVQVLHESLQETAAVLVVIGPRWTSVRDAGGIRRLDSEKDFVRREVEEALGRSIPVVPVLVQGATMPRAEDLPASLASLATRQAATLDHAEFHDDAERLCDRLATMLGTDPSTPWSRLRRWWPTAAGVGVLALGLIGYVALPTSNRKTTAATNATSANASEAVGVAEKTAPVEAGALDQTPRVKALLATASAQRQRNQFAEALGTLARARELAPTSTAVRQAQEDVAMDWIRDVRVESGKGSFGEAIAPALAVVDGSVASATGARRADLLAHTGWAIFLLWRDGDRRLSPAEKYREALSVDPKNPYANAMLAHWVLFQDHDKVPEAKRLFDTAVQSGRALDAVRTLQWAGYTNSSTGEATAERVRLADAMRRGNEMLNARQAQSLWGPYYFATPPSREQDRQVLLDALPPDDHISTLGWAFEEYAGKDESRRYTIRYYVALLHEKAGRTDQAGNDLRTLEKELMAAQITGSLRQGVEAALKRLQPGRGGRRLRSPP